MIVCPLKVGESSSGVAMGITMAEFMNPRPDGYPWKVNNSEKQFAALLEQSLPPNWCFWHAPTIHGGQTPDFIVFATESDLPAVLLIEQKHWRPGYIKRITLEKVFLNDRDERNPVLKLQEVKRNYEESLRPHYKTVLGLQDLAIIPILCMWKLPSRGVPLEFKEHSEVRIYSEEELDAGSFATAIRGTIMTEYARSGGEAPPLSNWMRRAIRENTDRAIRMPPPVGRVAVEKELPTGYSNRLRGTLDPSQVKVVRRCDQGHMLLSGVAGTGKTVVLLERARWHAENFPGSASPQLFIVNQKVLCNYLRQKYKAHFSLNNHGDNVVFSTYRDWLRETYQGATGRLRYLSETKMQTETSRIAEDAQRGSIGVKPTAKTRYSSIYIDEAHQLETEWIKLLVKFAEGALSSPNIWISYDNGQGIYRNRRFAGPTIGLNFQGRSKSFYRVYRSGLYSWLFSACCHPGALATYRDSADRSIEFVDKGEKPEGISGATLRDQAVKLFHFLKTRIDGGKSARSDITIFYATAGVGSDMYLDNLREVLDATFEPLGGLEWLAINKEGADFSVDKIRTCSFTSCQGLDSPVSVIFGVETFARFDDPDEWVEVQALFYTVITRSRELVVLTAKGFSVNSECPFLRALSVGIKKMKAVGPDLVRMKKVKADDGSEVYRLDWKKIDKYVYSGEDKT